MKKFIILTSISVIGYVGADVSLKTQSVSMKEEDLFPPQSLVNVLTQSPQCEVQDTVSIDTTITWNDFVSAVIYIESRGDSLAYNTKEKAVGVLQIRPIMLREVNRVLRKNKVPGKYVLQDRYSQEKSIEMFDIMAEQVSAEGISQMQFFEIVARRWNGGRRGDKKKATIKYWERIKNQLNIINYGKFSN
tara:strand:+ start:967 stop:1536 length:570 start_codon:yes stop_codon:yes gene_type:complete